MLLTLGWVYLLLATGVGLGLLVAGLCGDAARADLEDQLEQARRDRDAARNAAQRLDAQARRWESVRVVPRV